MVPADVAIVIEVVSVKTKLDKFLISAWNKETLILYVEIIVKLRQRENFAKSLHYFWLAPTSTTHNWASLQSKANLFIL